MKAILRSFAACVAAAAFVAGAVFLLATVVWRGLLCAGARCREAMRGAPGREYPSTAVRSILSRGAKPMTIRNMSLHGLPDTAGYRQNRGGLRQGMSSQP